MANKTMKLIPNKVKGTETMKRQDFEPFQGNLKKQNNESEIKDLCKRILKGFRAPIYIWEGHNLILDGHQRLKALKKLYGQGYMLEGDMVPVVRIEADTEKEAREAVLEYNSKYSEFDTEELNLWAPDLDLDGIRLGIDIDLGDDDKKDLGDEEEIVSWTKAKGVIHKGDIIQLGDHILMCGSSTDKDHVAELMGDKKADMVFTDPPYNMNFE